MIPEIVYKDYGVYYDELWPPPPRSWTLARMRLVKRVLPHLRTVCELGCGTGTSAIEFARKGLRVYGVDLSPTILKTARSKIRVAGVRVKLIQADMRSFRLPEAVDLISAEWGVVNHVPHRSDLLRVARAVASGLRPGGYFLFDVNHRILFEKSWAEPEIREGTNLFLVQEGGWDPQRAKGWIKMTWFVPGRAGMWRRYSQHAEEVQWTKSEIRKTLREAGFDRIRALDYITLKWKTRAPSSQRGYKTLYLARKKQA